jgi:polar amino acid transport system substrate-binding protein
MMPVRSRFRRTRAGSLKRVVMGALLLLAACGPASAPATVPARPSGLLAVILQRGTLVVSVESDYAPQSELKPDVARAEDTRCAPNQYTANQFTGFDVDVAREVASRLGVEPCFVTPRWSQVVSGGWDGVWDVSIGSMVITPERMRVLYFAQPYTSGSAVLFVHRDNQTYTDAASLSGKRIGVCAGCAYEAYLQHTLEIPGEQIDFAIDGATIVGYDTDTSALADLALGDGVKLDAVITDPDTGRLAIEGGLPIKQLAEPLYHDYVAPAVDRSSSRDPIPLIQKLTGIVQQMHADGTLAALSQQYYGWDATPFAAQFNIDTLKQFP